MQELASSGANWPGLGEEEVFLDHCKLGLVDRSSWFLFFVSLKISEIKLLSLILFVAPLVHCKFIELHLRLLLCNFVGLFS